MTYRGRFTGRSPALLPSCYATEKGFALLHEFGGVTLQGVRPDLRASRYALMQALMQALLAPQVVWVQHNGRILTLARKVLRNPTEFGTLGRGVFHIWDCRSGRTPCSVTPPNSWRRAKPFSVA